MHTHINPGQQPAYFGAASLQQPGDGLMSLLNLVPTQPATECSQRNDWWFCITDTVRQRNARIDDISRYAKPLPYPLVSVSLRIEISAVLHVCVHSCVRCLYSRAEHTAFTQDAEKLFFWNPQNPPTSKFDALLEAAKDGGAQ